MGEYEDLYGELSSIPENEPEVEHEDLYDEPSDIPEYDSMGADWDRDEAIEVINNSAWFEDKVKMLYIIPIKQNRDQIGPDNEIMDALVKAYRDAEEGKQMEAVEAKAEELGLVKIQDVLKRWSSEDGFYHA